jgi:hypothetical protein
VVQVSVVVGGSFTLCQDSYRKPCLFVVGGIGITALASMLASVVEQQQQQQQQGQEPEACTSQLRPFLLYSGQCASSSLAQMVVQQSFCAAQHVCLHKILVQYIVPCQWPMRTSAVYFCSCPPCLFTDIQTSGSAFMPNAPP